MLVALLDDGLDPCFVPKEKIARDLCVGEDGSIRERSAEDRFPTHHGSTVANIILRYAPDTVFCSLRIFYDDTLSAARRQLEAGLNWCLEQRIPVVHLSAGTKSMADYAGLRPIVARMVLQGQILIAAHSNSEGYCMPACMSGVFCVRADASLTGFSYAADTQENGMAFLASARHGEVCGGTAGLANSYAAPTVTAAVCLNYEEVTSERNRGQALYRKLTGKEPHYLTPDFAENAVVVNRSGAKLPGEAFFFGAGEERTYLPPDGDGSRNRSDRSLKRVLVWIPGKPEDPQEENMLIRAADREDIAGVIYCGTLTKQAREGLYEYLVWDEAKAPERRGYEPGKQKSENQAQIMLPLVMVLGERSKAVQFMAALQKCFLQERYACVCVSDIPMSYLFGMQHVPSGIFGIEELEGIRQGCHPDIVFCCSDHWMEGIRESHYFVIDLSGVCEKKGITANLNFLEERPENAVEEAGDRIMGYTWPD